MLRGLLQSGYEVDILSDSELPDVDGLNELITYLPFKLLSFRKMIFRTLNPPGVLGLSTRLENLLFRIDLRLSATAVLSRERYDFVYMRASFHGHALTKALRANKDTLVLEVNKPLSMASYNNASTDKWPAANERVRVSEAERLQYRAASLINVDSTLRLKWILDFVDVNLSEKALVNFNGVDSRMFSPFDQERIQRKTSSGIIVTKNNLGWEKESILVGVASSFRWYNDISEMLEIFIRASNTDRRLVFLIIVGDLKKAEELERAVSRTEISPRVKIIKQVPFSDMPIYLNACDILVSHFNFRGKWPHNCSIKHMEYLSVAKPVVATDVGEVNFAIEHGINGLLCNEGDVDGFAKAIVELASDASLRATFGAAGRAKAVDRLSWESHVTNVLEAIRE